MEANTKTYEQMLMFDNYIDRYNYLRFKQKVADISFGGSRYLNQRFYQSREWKDVRDRVILRDNGCDLGSAGFPIINRIHIHHINPITIEDICEGNDKVLNLSNLVCVSQETHSRIHFGENYTPYIIRPRVKGDTCPWTT